jgi:glycosyltransferase involved in cell wall biosynthesis
VDVSVCIATYRRPQGLARLLASLGRMKLPADAQVEVIVVDNDPDAEETLALPPAGALSVRRVREPRRNIARARNRAVAIARGAWLAFVDDDEEVHEGWLAAFLAQAERRQCDGLFGPVVPRAQEPERGGLEWLAFFERGRFAGGARVPLASACTHNAFVRRRLFDDAAFEPEFGRSGGEDTQLFGLLLARGADFRWCDEARVDEWLPAERLRPAWLLRRAFRAGSALGRIRRRRPAWPAALPHALAALASALVLLPPAAAMGRAHRLRSAMRVCGAAGRVFGLLGGRYEEYK